MYNERKKKYDMQYARDKLKHIPLTMQKDKYSEIKHHATASGETVNGFIKIAIDERIERLQAPDAPTARSKSLEPPQSATAQADKPP